MRKPERIDKILTKIRDEWIQNPDLRLGQLLIAKFGYPSADPFYVEDDVFGVDVFEKSECYKKAKKALDKINMSYSRR